MIVIVGAGLSGLSTAMFLKREYCLLEKEASPGGLARSIRQDGFTFDYTGHWLHVRLPWINDLLNCMPGMWKHHQRDARIWSHERLIPYPFQINLGSLPYDVVLECLMGMIEARAKRWSRPIRTFEDFILRSMGKGVARHFMIPYNCKIWKLHPRRMTTDWMGRFVPRPEIEKALRSALRPSEVLATGYNAGFQYPVSGGINMLPKELARHVGNLRLNVAVEEVSLKRRQVRLSDGTCLDFSHLVSSMPLKQLVDRTVDAPARIRAAAERLAWTSVMCLHLGVTDVRQPLHWVYVPQSEIPFYRIGCYSNVDAGLAPAGAGAFYVEFSYRKRVSASAFRIDPETVVKHMKRIGLVGPQAHLLTAVYTPIEYAYVAYNADRKAAVRTLLDFYQAHGVCSIGRYGAWEYSSMEDAMEIGRQTAETFNRE
ncbi:MAG: NAD(P)-binding protein [Thermoguttaceae bacterium]|jgi:protoporphyrinogen oxidase